MRLHRFFRKNATFMRVQRYQKDKYDAQKIIHLEKKKAPSGT